MATARALHRSSRHRYRNVWERRHGKKSKSSVFEGSSRASSVRLLVYGKSKLSNEARGWVFALTHRLTPSSQENSRLTPSFDSYPPSSTEILDLLSSYLCPPYSHFSLPLALSPSRLSLPLTAAAIHTGPPRNVPIVVAGQHYRTTEASNAILTEEPVIGQCFSGEGLLQCCMTTSLCTYFCKQELEVVKVS